MNVVVVTALLDIGRGDWSTRHKRSIDRYLDSFSNVCKLENYMIIWTTVDLVDRVRKLRIGKEDGTCIKICSLEDCRLFSRKTKIDKIMEKNKTREYNHDQARYAPEFTSSEYVILVNNKIEFIRQSINLIPKTDFFVWIDAGYSFKTFDMENKRVIIPDNLLGKVFMIKLWKYWFDPTPSVFQNEWPLDVVDGGFVSIDSNLVYNFAEMYYTLIDKILDQGIIDDDQFFMTIMYTRQPDVFSLEDGEWFGGCKYILSESLADAK